MNNAEKIRIKKASTRFQDGLKKLEECNRHLMDIEYDMDKKEIKAKERLIQLCKEIGEEFNY